MTTNPTGIVRWAMAAFHANPEASDDEIVTILRNAGLPRAGHVVAMLPLAFGRRILEGLVELPTSFVELDARGEIAREGPLAEDPIFAAADRIARAEATRADLDRIGLLSAEVNAVNQALHAGSQPGDLLMSPPMMRLGDDDDAELSHVPPAPDAQTMVDELVRAHGASLALETRVFPSTVKAGRVQLQLDVLAKVGARDLNESFGGLGVTIHAALTDAVGKLARGSLHVLLATLVERDLGADQVDWERWGEFDACLGPLLRMWSDAAPGRLGDYLDALRDRLLAASLSREPHWVRTFIATDGTEILGLDVLLDNDAFEPGVELARSWAWPKAEGYYALRHFFMLLPVADQSRL